MESNDATARLAYETRRLRDLIEEKGELWADQGGRTTLHEYLHPHAEAAEDLVAALRGHDELLAAFEEEMAIVERELELAAAAHRRTEAALAQAMEDVRAADETLPEVLQDVAAAARLEARAVRLADLANEYPGAQEPSPVLILPQPSAERRTLLRTLALAYPQLEVSHILEGDFNSKGEFSGFHSFTSQVGKVLKRLASDRNGVYEAVVAGVTLDGRTVRKDVRKHTMFPDAWTGDRICREILWAYNHQTSDDEVSENGRWRGTTKSGMQISGHIRNRNLVIGHPIMGKELDVGRRNNAPGSARASR